MLSVPSYTIHRDVEVWGGDASVFRPKSRFEKADDAMQNAFSYGLRFPRFVPSDKLPRAGYLSLLVFAGLVSDETFLELLNDHYIHLYFVNTLISQ